MVQRAPTRPAAERAALVEACDLAAGDPEAAQVLRAEQSPLAVQVTLPVELSPAVGPAILLAELSPAAVLAILLAELSPAAVLAIPLRAAEAPAGAAGASPAVQRREAAQALPTRAAPRVVRARLVTLQATQERWACSWLLGSLSATVATGDFALCLPESWTSNPERLAEARVPERDVQDQARAGSGSHRARRWVPHGLGLANSAYGDNPESKPPDDAGNP